MLDDKKKKQEGQDQKDQKGQTDQNRKTQQNQRVGTQSTQDSGVESEGSESHRPGENTEQNTDRRLNEFSEDDANAKKRRK